MPVPVDERGGSSPLPPILPPTSETEAVEAGTIPGFAAFDLDRFATVLPGGRASWGGRIARRTHHLIRGLIAHNGFQAAAAMAFHFFLSLIPLLVLAGSLLAHIVRANGAEALVTPILGALPREAAELLQRELEGMGGAAQLGAAPLSVLGFLVVASGGAHNLMDVFEVAVGARRRPWWKKRALALGWIVAMVSMTSLVAWAFVFTGSALKRIDWATVLHQGGRGAGLSHLIVRLGWESAPALVVLAGVGAGGLAAFYRFGVSRPAAIRRRSWPGATLALALFFLFSWGFGFYASTLGRYAAYYGSLAAVCIVLMWLYATSFALLLGAELNAQLEGVRPLGSLSPPAS